MIKVTRRERLEMVIRGEITEELIEECKAELEKLDMRSRAALQRSKETETYRENKEVEQRIVEVLSEEPIQIEELGEKLGWKGSRQKLTSLCTNLVREGIVKVIEVKVKNKGKRKAYHL